MNTYNTTIKNGIIRVTTTKNATVQPKQAMVRLALYDTVCAECLEEVQRITKQEKSKLWKEVSSILEKEIQTKCIKESIVEQERDNAKEYKFCCNYELLLNVEELFPLEKWEKITNIAGNVEMLFYYVVSDLDEIRQDLMSEALVLNEKRAGILAGKVKRIVTWPQCISYSQQDEKNNLCASMVDNFYGGCVYYKYDKEKNIREFAHELVTEEIRVTENVYVEWIIV